MNEEITMGVGRLHRERGRWPGPQGKVMATALARGQLFPDKKADGAKARQAEAEGAQREQKWQDTRRRHRSKRPVASHNRPFDLGGKLAGVQIVSKRDGGQEHCRQHGKRHDLQADARNQGPLTPTTPTPEPQSPQRD